MILIIDNYDFFTYNLVHLVAAKTDDYKVICNDALIARKRAEKVMEPIREVTGIVRHF